MQQKSTFCVNLPRREYWREIASIWDKLFHKSVFFPLELSFDSFCNICWWCLLDWQRHFEISWNKCCKDFIVTTIDCMYMYNWGDSNIIKVSESFHLCTLMKLSLFFDKAVFIHNVMCVSNLYQVFTVNIKEEFHFYSQKAMILYKVPLKTVQTYFMRIKFSSKQQSSL